MISITESALIYAFDVPTEQVFSNRLQSYKEILKIFTAVSTEASMEMVCFKDEYCIGFRRRGQL